MVRRAKLALWLVALALTLLAAAGFGFAGSPSRIADGVTVAGVDVGGLTAGEAEAALAALAREYEGVAVTFTVGERRWPLRPDRLDLKVDWHAAVASALAAGDGPMPLRGLERLKVRLFGVDLEPHADVYEARLRHEIARMAGAVNAPAREAAIVLDDLRPRIGVRHAAHLGRQRRVGGHDQLRRHAQLGVDPRHRRVGTGVGGPHPADTDQADAEVVTPGGGWLSHQWSPPLASSFRAAWRAVLHPVRPGA